MSSEQSSLGDLLVYLLTGILIVLLVLCSLWMAVSILGRIFKYLDLKDPIPESPGKSNAIKEVSSTHASSPIQITPELMAVIGAALHTVIKGPFKIISVEETPEKPKS